MGTIKCGCIYADSRNTKSVRTKAELGGYLKERCNKHRSEFDLRVNPRYTEDKMKLTEYIEKHYNGNKRAFALDNGMTAQQVTPMINKGNYHVIDGYLCQMKKKMIIPGQA